MTKPSLGRVLRFQWCRSHTHLSTRKGSAVFYQNITSPKPRSSPTADGTQGLSRNISSAAQVHLTGDFCKSSNQARNRGCWAVQGSPLWEPGMDWKSRCCQQKEPLDLVLAAGMLPSTFGDINTGSCHHGLSDWHQLGLSCTMGSPGLIQKLGYSSRLEIIRKVSWFSLLNPLCSAENRICFWDIGVKYQTKSGRGMDAQR